MPYYKACQKHAYKIHVTQTCTFVGKSNNTVGMGRENSKSPARDATIENHDATKIEFNVESRMTKLSKYPSTGFRVGEAISGPEHGLIRDFSFEQTLRPRVQICICYIDSAIRSKSLSRRAATWLSAKWLSSTSADKQTRNRANLEEGTLVVVLLQKVPLLFLEVRRLGSFWVLSLPFAPFFLCHTANHLQLLTLLERSERAPRTRCNADVSTPLIVSQASPLPLPGVCSRNHNFYQKHQAPVLLHSSHWQRGHPRNKSRDLITEKRFFPG